MDNLLDGLTFSNPRTEAIFDDWPIGRSDRGKCHFVVETGNRGERMTRRTTNKDGVWCKPKKTTYYQRWCIVDGSNGRTYLLAHTGHSIFVYLSDVQHQLASLYPLKDTDTYRPADSERYDELATLLRKRTAKRPFLISRTETDGEE